MTAASTNSAAFLEEFAIDLRVYLDLFQAATAQVHVVLLRVDRCATALWRLMTVHTDFIFDAPDLNLVYVV